LISTTLAGAAIHIVFLPLVKLIQKYNILSIIN